MKAWGFMCGAELCVTDSGGRRLYFGKGVKLMIETRESDLIHHIIISFLSLITSIKHEVSLIL